MLNLRQYKNTADRLADHLPWALLVAPGVVLNKDGSFQRTLRYQGPDLESSTLAELVSISARVNNVLRRFGSGWGLFFEARRSPALEYPATGDATGVAALVDEERRALFDGQASGHFETRYFLTLVYMPAPDVVASAGRAFMEAPEDLGQRSERDWNRELETFVTRTNSAIDLLSTFMPFVEALDDEESLTYLHGAISENPHRVRVPEMPVYLDACLVDTPLFGGMAPRLGERHLRTLTVLGMPGVTRPGLLDALNHLDIGYRWVTRFICLDKELATKTLTRARRQWFNKRKSVTALLREVMYSQPTQLTDTDADNKVADADLALQTLGGDEVGFGYLTMTVTLLAPDAQAADEQIRRVEQVINGLGFTTVRETLNAVEAWLSSLPGHLYANVRQPLVHTLNLAHLMPLSAVWAGEPRNTHLDGPPLLYALSSGATPFRLSTHVGDVGHMMILGPTGAGKSVLLSFIALSFMRYSNAQVFLFDKGGSARAMTLAVKGRHHTVGRTADLSFQPLRHIDDPAERTWSSEWLQLLLEGEGVAVTPEIKVELWSALNSLATAPERQRTLTGLTALLSSKPLKTAFQPFTLEGPFGQCLDADEDALDLADIHCFETEELMGERNLIAPVLTYIFHRLEARFDGRPTLLILDEAWVFLDNPMFAARIREWLKVLRKKNVSVLFATQSLSDVIDSPIAPAVIESCPQRIFLPNERAREPQSEAAYLRIGLNHRQIELIAQALPKREYYLQSRRGNRLFDLNLGTLALAVCAASTPEDQQLIDRLLEKGSEEDFAAAFLKSRDLNWAADLLKAPP
ncbi:conjugal transfer protein TrbE [Asticcacaulis sp.]|uniref:conjugal transfer protein TrbE n=1 Tax=Asticcacaulis sp. TaxID=1872648 RepID=UPI003F7CA066